MKNIRSFLEIFRKLMRILSNKQKKCAIGVATIMLIVALLETLGVSVIIPFILALLQPEMLMQYDIVKEIMFFFNFDSPSSVLGIIVILVVATYVLKNLFILFANHVQISFRNKLEKDLSVVMMKAYMAKSYIKHINMNSSEVIRGVTGDISGVASTVDCYTTILNEGLTSILIGIFLIYINPFMAIGILVVAGVTAGLIVLGFRRKISECGKVCRESFQKRNQILLQSIHGIKEIAVMQRQDFFVKDFEKEATNACRYNTTYLWISKTPSRIIETMFIGSLIVLAYFCMGDTNVVAADYVAQLGAMATAAMRILPSISSIAGAFNSLIYNRPSLEGAYENLCKVNIEKDMEAGNVSTSKTNELQFRSKIEIQNIKWRYSENLKNILNGINLTIYKGKSIALVGESGAGKTTLADVILGLFHPQEGDILVDGKSIFQNKVAWSRLIGYVPQAVYLLDDTVRNNIAFGIPASEIDDEKIWKALEQAHLEDVVRKMSKGLDTVLGERGVKISGGQRQRIAIARALYYNPEIIVLDEATSALDHETETAVMESIDALQGQKTLIIVAHRLSTIKNCDEIYEIKDGEAHMRTYESLT